MARKLPQLQEIISNEPITGENHYDFLWHLQNALLLALREGERLNAVQLRFAMEKLNRQRRERAKKLLDGKEPG